MINQIWPDKTLQFLQESKYQFYQLPRLISNNVYYAQYDPILCNVLEGNGFKLIDKKRLGVSELGINEVYEIGLGDYHVVLVSELYNYVNAYRMFDALFYLIGDGDTDKTRSAWENIYKMLNKLFLLDQEARYS